MNVISKTHKGIQYVIEWSEENRILTLEFMTIDSTIIGRKNIKLYGSINQNQLKDIITDHWKVFVKNELINN